MEGQNQKHSNPLLYFIQRTQNLEYFSSSIIVITIIMTDDIVTIFIIMLIIFIVIYRLFSFLAINRNDLKPHPLRSREDLQDIKIIVVIYYISLGYQSHHSEVMQIVPANIMNFKNQETVILFEHRDFRRNNDETKVQICRKIREKNSPHNNLLSSTSKEQKYVKLLTRNCILALFASLFKYRFCELFTRIINFFMLISAKDKQNKIYP